MLRVLFLFLVLIVSLVFGLILAGHQGYVLIQTDNYNIETSVTGLAIMVLLLVVMLMAIEWVLRHIFLRGARTRSWFVGRKRSRARAQIKAALIKLAEGDYKQFESLLTRNADHAEQPMLNYLLVAEAAQQRCDDFSTNQYLERAAEVSDTDQLPVDITRVRIQLAQGEDHATRHCVSRLLNQASRHPAVLWLAEQAYLRARVPTTSLLEILPSMRKIELHSESKLKLQALQQQAYIGLMNQAMAAEGSDGLKHWWKAQIHKTRHEVPLQIAMVERLIECNDDEMVQEIVLDSLKRHYDERLVILIPRLKSGNQERLEKALHQQVKQ